MSADSVVSRFPCDTCGGDLRFSPGTNQMVCAHCGAETAIEDAGPWTGIAIRELDFHSALKGELSADDIEETRVIACENCGAQVEFDEATHAAECPFCATPVVTQTGTHRHIKPRGLLPFKLDENRAREAMSNWLGRLWFAPGGLRKYARKGRRMSGIYVPYWTYDADTDSGYRGQRGDAYYVQQQVQVRGKDGRMQTQTRRVRKIRWTPVKGRVARHFDDVLVLASKSLPKRNTDALGPWDLSGLEPYRAEYLAGFRAEGYTVSLEDGYAEARGIMDATIARDVKFDIGGDQQRIEDIETQISDLTFKHVLLPVWMAAYKYRGKTYRFVVNGRTGAVQGERPYSTIKIAIAVAIGLLVAAAFGYSMAGQSGY